MNLLNTNISKVCRTCLEQKNEMISLYSVDINSGIQICDMILQTSQVQVFSKDNAPTAICEECHYKLNVAFQFNQQCKNSELKLQEFIRNSFTSQNEQNVNEKAIEDAVQELFGNETSEQDMNYQPNMVLASTDFDTNLKSSDLLNMDIILGEKSPKKTKKPISGKAKASKGKSHLDELLKGHKERMKLENSSKIQIFKQRRKKKLTSLIEPEQCFQCGKVFHYKGYMELHLRTHSNFKAYECNVCNKRFTQVSNLNLHLRTHSKEKPFACHKCPKMFSTSSNLKAHLRTHIDFRGFKCNLCSKAFKSSTELKSHEGTHSQIKSKICKFCGKTFYKTSYLNVHIKNIHYGLKKYQCDGCNKSFSNSSNLIAHKRIHSGEKPFVCKFDGCNAKFNQSSSLQRHMKSHNKGGKIVKTDQNQQQQQQQQQEQQQQQQEQENEVPLTESFQQQMHQQNQSQSIHSIHNINNQPPPMPQNQILQSNQNQIHSQQPIVQQISQNHQQSNIIHIQHSQQQLNHQNTHQQVQVQQSTMQTIHMLPQQVQPNIPTKPIKKTPYIIPELLKDINISDSPSTSSHDPIISNRIKSLPSCQQQIHHQPQQQQQQQPMNQQNYSSSQQSSSSSLLPEALNPMNLINNNSNSNYNSTITSHSTSSLLALPPLPTHHESGQMSDHQMHHFPNFENTTTTYLPPTPNILPNSFNFIMGGLDFSKNSLNGEPTYIDY